MTCYYFGHRPERSWNSGLQPQFEQKWLSFKNELTFVVQGLPHVLATELDTSGSGFVSFCPDFYIFWTIANLAVVEKFE